MRLFATRLEPLLRLGGIRVPRFWVAVDEADRVLGTVGLYETGDGVLWLGWFCTAPEARGRGVGRRLLNHAIDTARSEGQSSLRLYTSTDPNEAAAQILYERMGSRVTTRMRPFLWRLVGASTEILYRERHLMP